MVAGMGKCSDCQREMWLAPSCLETTVIVARGQTFQRIRHPDDAVERCEDCGVQPGGIHHYGCDMERCPACEGQLIMCGG